MVDVGQKQPSHRRAIAEGAVHASAAAFAALRDGTVKGDVLAAARIAGIMAAKRVPDLIPLCHTVNLSRVAVTLEIDEGRGHIRITAEVEAQDRTGVEMEALTAVSVAGLTLYDMLKSVDRSMTIEGVHLIEKHGGQSGSYLRPMQVVPKSPPPEPILPETDTADIVEDWTTAELDAEVAVRSVELLFGVAAGARSHHRRPSAQARKLADHVTRITVDDPTLIARLGPDPIGCAYMLGDMDGPYAEHGRWWGLRGERDELEGVLLVYEGLSVPALLTSGGTVEVEALMLAARAELPRQFYAHMRLHHREAVDLFYDLGSTKKMIRMGLRKGDWKQAADSAGVFELSHRDTGAMMLLYRHYPDNFFEPAQLDTGLYFGLHEGDELVSVAGIHVFSEKHDVAAIGNIVTHSEHRGKGLASHCVAALLEALFARVTHVALNVEVGNDAAVACYHKFGFREHYRFIEGNATAW